MARPWTAHCGLEAEQGLEIGDGLLPGGEDVVDPEFAAVQAVARNGFAGLLYRECPRPDTRLTYIINIVLTTEFALDRPNLSWIESQNGTHAELR